MFFIALWWNSVCMFIDWLLSSIGFVFDKKKYFTTCFMFLKVKLGQTFPLTLNNLKMVIYASNLVHMFSGIITRMHIFLFFWISFSFIVDANCIFFMTILYVGESESSVNERKAVTYSSVRYLAEVLRRYSHYKYEK